MLKRQIRLLSTRQDCQTREFFWLNLKVPHGLTKWRGIGYQTVIFAIKSSHCLSWNSRSLNFSFLIKFELFISSLKCIRAGGNTKKKRSKIFSDSQIEKLFWLISKRWSVGLDELDFLFVNEERSVSTNPSFSTILRLTRSHIN